MKQAMPEAGTTSSLSTLGERIKAVRSTWGWSQEEMAETLRVDQASISFWERDKIVPSGSAMVALSALFRCSMGSLENGNGFVIPDPPSPLPLTDTNLLRSVSLRSCEEGAIGVVNLLTGTSTGKSVSEAMVDLVQAVKQGRQVWITME